MGPGEPQRLTAEDQAYVNICQNTNRGRGVIVEALIGGDTGGVTAPRRRRSTWAQGVAHVADVANVKTLPSRGEDPCSPTASP